MKPWRFLIDLLMVLICSQSNHSNDLPCDLRVQMKDVAVWGALQIGSAVLRVLTGFSDLVAAKCAPGCRVRYVII